MSGMALGSLVGFSVGALLFRRFKVFGQIVAWLLPVLGICFLLLATTRTPWIACSIMFGIGLFSGINSSCIISGVQTIVPSEMLGRTLGILGTMSGAAAPVAMGD